MQESKAAHCDKMHCVRLNKNHNAFSLMLPLFVVTIALAVGFVVYKFIPKEKEVPIEPETVKDEKVTENESPFNKFAQKSSDADHDKAVYEPKDLGISLLLPKGYDDIETFEGIIKISGPDNVVSDKGDIENGWVLFIIYGEKPELSDDRIRAKNTFEVYNVADIDLDGNKTHFYYNTEGIKSKTVDDKKVYYFELKAKEKNEYSRDQIWSVFSNDKFNFATSIIYNDTDFNSNELMAREILDSLSFIH